MTGALRVSRLIRGDAPAARSVEAVRRLVAVVGEWPSDAGVALTIAAGSRRGRVNIRVECDGPVSPDWSDDVRWALRDVAELHRTTVAAVSPYRSVTEVRAEREFAIPAPDDGLECDEATAAARRRSERLAPPWPAGRFDDGIPLLELLASKPGTAVRFHLAAASSIEREMTGDALRGSWVGDAEELSTYLGRPVRLRMLLGSKSDQVPPRLLAIVRRWASELHLVELDGSEAMAAWSGTDGGIIGRSVPEGMAIGLVRVPTAGQGPVPGVRSVLPAWEGIPLDPVPPTPKRAIRIGTARSVDGKPLQVELDVHDLLRHTAIEGASGSGKSSLLVDLIHRLAAAGISYTFLDPDGSTARWASELLPDEARPTTLLIEHGRENAIFPLNPFRRSGEDLDRVIETFTDMLQDKDDPRGEGIVGPRFRRWIGLVSQATAAAFGDRMSLPLVAAVASDNLRIRRLARRISATHPELAHRLEHEYGRLEAKESVELISWAVSKLHPFIANERVRRTLGAGPTAVDVGHAMATGRSLLIDLASPSIGAPSARMLGALWIMEHWLALGRRPNPETPHVLICDEAHLFQFGALPWLVAEGRKYGLGIVLATQDLSRLTPRLADALEANAGSFISLRCGPQSAVRASQRLQGWPVASLTRLPDLKAAATLSRNGIMTEPFTLTIDRPDRLTAPTRAAEERHDSYTALSEHGKAHCADPFRRALPVSDAALERELARDPEDARAPVGRQYWPSTGKESAHDQKDADIPPAPDRDADRAPLRSAGTGATDGPHLRLPRATLDGV